MKAASLLRHIWVGGLICTIYLAATGVAYANASTNDSTIEAESMAKEAPVLQQEQPPKKKVDTASITKEGKTASKPAEVKKGEPSNYFSFSFLYYLFYKAKFAESTNNALNNSIKSLISRFIG